MPAPMMATSTLLGRSLVERKESRRWSSLRQYEAVGLGTGSMAGGIRWADIVIHSSILLDEQKHAMTRWVRDEIGM